MFFLSTTIIHALFRRHFFVLLQKNSDASEGAIAFRDNRTPGTFNVKLGTEMHKNHSHERRDSIKQFNKVQEKLPIFPQLCLNTI